MGSSDVEGRRDDATALCAQRHHARVSSPASDVIRAIAPDLFWNAAGGGVFFLGTNSGGGGAAARRRRSYSTRTRTRTAGTRDSGTASSASSTTFTGDAGRAFGAAHAMRSLTACAARVARCSPSASWICVASAVSARLVRFGGGVFQESFCRLDGVDGVPRERLGRLVRRRREHDIYSSAPGASQCFFQISIALRARIARVGHTGASRGQTVERGRRPKRSNPCAAFSISLIPRC